MAILDWAVGIDEISKKVTFNLDLKYGKEPAIGRSEKKTFQVESG